MELTELLTTQDLDKVWQDSEKHLVFLFKQSTTCPVSATAFKEFNEFLKKDHEEDFSAYFVKVRETREVSNKIEEETGVRHQSPQALVIKNKEVVWESSHFNITKGRLEIALQNNI